MYFYLFPLCFRNPTDSYLQFKLSTDSSKVGNGPVFVGSTTQSETTEEDYFTKECLSLTRIIIIHSLIEDILLI